LVPVKVGLTKFAFKFNAANCALDTGLFASVLSALPKPILILTAPNDDGFQVLVLIISTKNDYWVVITEYHH
jgi:hypothetical protein